MFRKVETFSQVEVARFGSPSLITRNTNDVQQVQTVVFMGLTVMVTAPIMIVGGIVMAVREDGPLALLLLAVLPAMALVIGITMYRAIPLFQAMQRRIDRINQVLRETLAGVRVIRAFVRTRHEEERFAVANHDVFDAGLRVNRMFAVTIPVLTAIMNLATVAVMWFGAMRINDGALQIGNLTAFLQYLLQIMFSVLTAVLMFILIPRAAVSSGRIREVLETDPVIGDPPDPHPARGHRTGAGRIELRDVSFRYPGAQDPVLSGISFRAGPGETTAIVGSTGSGKTTLINLIPRLADVTEGSVLIDGIDVREMDRQDLWARVGFVPQKAYLFSGTVASNLRYGDADATDEQLWHALEVAQARDFVAQMEAGLEAPITQGGTNVSGGQRQRLAIARAIVHRPDVFVFDDSFSALDMAHRRAPPGGAGPGAPRRDHHHRRPAGGHHHGRRPHRGPRGRPGGGRGHPCGAAGDQRYLSRDRQLPAGRDGDGGMSRGPGIPRSSRWPAGRWPGDDGHGHRHARRPVERLPGHRAPSAGTPATGAAAHRPGHPARRRQRPVRGPRAGHPG